MEAITYFRSKRAEAADIVRTLPYPGFLTDTAPCSAAGDCKGNQHSNRDRFREQVQARELMKMGANITLEGRIAVIKGVEKLKAFVYARDLRVPPHWSWHAAEGQTVINDIKHLDRGRGKNEENFPALGHR